MCGVCGLLDNGPQWSDPLRQDIPLRQLRLRQLALLNRTLKPWRLSLTEFHGQWLLASPTGQQVLVTPWIGCGKKPRTCCIRRLIRSMMPG